MKRSKIQQLETIAVNYVFYLSPLASRQRRQLTLSKFWIVGKLAENFFLIICCNFLRCLLFKPTPPLFITERRVALQTGREVVFYCRALHFSIML